MYTSPALILNSMWAKKIKTISSVCLKPRTKTEALGKVSRGVVSGVMTLLKTSI